MFTDRGFLPTPDPMTQLLDPDLSCIEHLARRLPDDVANHDFRHRCVNYCRELKPTALAAFLQGDNHLGTERLFMLLAYCASAYVHGETPELYRLPQVLARPLVRVARYLKRPPILSYSSYCLHNWRRLHPGQPIFLENLELLQNFSSEAKEDEDWFILIHVEIEARAHAALAGVAKIHQLLKDRKVAGEAPEEIVFPLEEVLDSLRAMNQTLARMPEHCRPEVYFQKVRPYIFGFKNMVYSGCFDDMPQTLRGETGAQSSILPSLINAFGIRHKQSMLTEHLEDMKNYMPKEHRDFVESFSLGSLNRGYDLRSFAMRQVFSKRSAAMQVIQLYNDCVQEITAFRSKHLQYAVEYIQKRIDNPEGTGGTPYMEWLQQLVEETKQFIIPVDK